MCTATLATSSSTLLMKSSFVRYLKILSLLTLLTFVTGAIAEEPKSLRGLLVFREADCPSLPFQGYSRSVCVASLDQPELNHKANSILARVAWISLSPTNGPIHIAHETFDERVYYVESGYGKAQGASWTFNLAPGDILFMPSAEQYSLSANYYGLLKLFEARWAPSSGVPDRNVPPFVIPSTARPSPIDFPSTDRRKKGVRSWLFVYPKVMSDYNHHTANSLMAAFGMSEYIPGGGTVTHFHHEREQVWVVLSGHATFTVGGYDVKGGPGDVIFLPRYVRHGQLVTGDEPCRWLELDWEQYPQK